MTAKLMTDMYGNGRLVPQPMDVEDMYSHELAAAEDAAGITPVLRGGSSDQFHYTGNRVPDARLSQPPPSPQRRTYSFEEQVVAAGTSRIRRPILAQFRPLWLIVGTRGFGIRLVLSHVRLLVGDAVSGDVDGDLFMRENWDRVASLGELDRLKLPDVAIDLGNELILHVTPRPTLLTIKGQLRRFSAMVIGEEPAQRVY